MAVTIAMPHQPEGFAISATPPQLFGKLEGVFSTLCRFSAINRPLQSDVGNMMSDLTTVGGGCSNGSVDNNRKWLW